MNLHFFESQLEILQDVPEGPWDCSKMGSGFSCSSRENLWSDITAAAAPSRTSVPRPKPKKTLISPQIMSQATKGAKRKMGRRSVARKWAPAEGIVVPLELATRALLPAVNPLTVRHFLADMRAVSDDSHQICLNAHGVAQVAIHSQVASQGTGVVKDRNADMAMW
jgi:hypothetical protein